MRTRVIILLLAAAAAVGCSEIFDELGVSPEDQEEFEEFMEAVADAAATAGDDGSGGNGSGGDGSDGDASPNDPGWSPDAMPAPSPDPTASADRSDSPACPAGWTCGEAQYRREDDQAVRDHYEDLFGRPPDSTSEDVRSEDVYMYGSTWDDGDVRVEVHSFANGTEVAVSADTSNPG